MRDTIHHLLRLQIVMLQCTWTCSDMRFHPSNFFTISKHLKRTIAKRRAASANLSTATTENLVVLNHNGSTQETPHPLQVLEQRVETLERELDAAIIATARARSKKQQVEAAQKAAELHAEKVTRELENTTRVLGTAAYKDRFPI